MCTFSADVDPVLFYLNSVQAKYQVIAIRIVNIAKTPLLLSRSQDRVEFQFGSQTAAGMLDITDNNGQFWSSFSLKIRQVIAYPNRVEDGEEESVYVLVPWDKLSGFEKTRQH